MGNYHQLYYHVTWAVVKRQLMLDSELRKSLYDYLKGKTVDMGGIAFAVGGFAEHIHLCLMIPPHITIAKFIEKLKGASAQWVNLIARPDGSFGWQDGYGVFTVSKEILERTVSYINNQEQHHRNAIATVKDWEIPTRKYSPNSAQPAGVP